MKITFLGHASLSINTRGKNIIVDPFITNNPLASQIDVSGIEADYILITHAHGDHVGDVEVIAQRTGAMIISNFEITSYYQNKGFNGHPLNQGGKKQFEFGTLKYVNAIHSSTFPDGTYGGNPGGFVLWNDEGCIYIAGDTALTEDLKLIPKTCPKLDLAVLPIGDNFTMGYEDASIATDYVHCDRALGYHYNTFPPIEIDTNEATQLFSKNQKELILINIGESMEV